MADSMSLEELAKLRTAARTEHFAAREARAAHTIEMTKRLASGAPIDPDFVRQGEELQVAVNAAQAKFKQLDKQHLAAFRAATAP
ncbi:MAG: hypothetical protein EXR66_08190 [Dehalococcoidia bacterium]|nr:hypothetical protein [Dehalococcoidia bacterium]